MARAEAAAATLARDLPAPIDPAQLARELAVTVVTQPGPPDLSGMLLHRDGHTVIGVNSTRSAAQQRFATAHALGHHRLHPARPALVCTARQIREPASAAYATDREEAEANRFAIALLLPEAAVRDLLDKGEHAGLDAAQTVADAFEVSLPVAAARLLMLGLIPGA